MICLVLNPLLGQLSFPDFPMNGAFHCFVKRDKEMMAETGYGKPLVVLTMVDKVEEKLARQFRGLAPSLLEMKVSEALDFKINQVCSKLRIPRDNVTYLENYHAIRRPFDCQLDRLMLKGD